MFISYSKPYILGGRSSFTIKTAKGLYHYKVSKKKDKDSSLWFIYCSLNERDWQYLGMIISNYKFTLTAKSEHNEGEPITMAFAYLWKLALNEEDTDKIKMWHDGTCSVCGLRLTDETSVEIGVGPTCRKKLGI